MNKDTLRDVLIVVGAAVLVGFAFLFGSLSGLGFGWLSGKILEFMAGQYLANGLNMLFNTNRFFPEHIPLITATLGVFGAYFRPSNTKNNKK